MCRHSRPPSQGWRTFLSNHADGIAAIDLFVLPTIAFQILYCLVIVRHGRRLWVSFGVTANPTAEWISRQVTEAFPWDRAPRYLMRDRDTSCGPAFLQRIRAMGIRRRIVPQGAFGQSAGCFPVPKEGRDLQRFSAENYLPVMGAKRLKSLNRLQSCWDRQQLGPFYKGFL